jgi:hypothetical protein
MKVQKTLDGAERLFIETPVKFFKVKLPFLTFGSCSALVEAQHDNPEHPEVLSFLGEVKTKLSSPVGTWLARVSSDQLLTLAFRSVPVREFSTEFSYSPSGPVCGLLRFAPRLQTVSFKELLRVNYDGGHCGAYFRTSVAGRAFSGRLDIYPTDERLEANAFWLPPLGRIGISSWVDFHKRKILDAQLVAQTDLGPTSWTFFANSLNEAVGAHATWQIRKGLRAGVSGVIDGIVTHRSGLATVAALWRREKVEIKVIARTDVEIDFRVTLEPVRNTAMSFTAAVVPGGKSTFGAEVVLNLIE